MRSWPMWWFLMIAGCGGADVDGRWVGDCTISGETTTMDVNLEADGDTVTGDGLVGDIAYGEAPVTVTGTLSGKNIEFDMVYDFFGSDTGGYVADIDLGIKFGVEAKVKGDTMDGKCRITVMGFGVANDIELTRQ